MAGNNFVPGGLEFVQNGAGPGQKDFSHGGEPHCAAEAIKKAGDAYNLHATGYTFDIARRYAGHAEALAFQYVLDRLTALDLIAWVREPATIHITVAHDATRLEAPMGIHP